MLTLISRRPTFFSSTSTPGRDVRDQLVAVGVDLLDGMVAMTTRIWPKMMSRASWRSLHAQAEQALGGVFHDAGLGRDADHEGRRGVDADVLLRERALELDVDRDRREVEELVVLDERPDERGAAVVATRADLPPPTLP